MFSWLKKLFGKKSPRQPTQTIGFADICRSIVAAECFKTGQMVTGNLDDEDNLHLSYLDGSKRIITKEELLK